VDSGTLYIPYSCGVLFSGQELVALSVLCECDGWNPIFNWAFSAFYGAWAMAGECFYGQCEFFYICVPSFATGICHQGFV
jgi:hypothetical protein